MSTTLKSMLRDETPLLWLNPSDVPAAQALQGLPLQQADIADAQARLARWAPVLCTLFPELRASGGAIESALVELQGAAAELAAGMPGRLFVKCDHALPVAGSVKARGGVYEVLAFAESLQEASGLPAMADDALNPSLRALFGRYTVSVGSTGNLGLGIGIIASALGFRTRIHMSRIAKEWKKERLRQRGVEVIEHDGDFSEAVAAGRREANTAHDYFVDDEHSERLFLGYAAAATGLRAQLAAAGVTVDAAHPLFVYIPCGVGGAPGGISFGLKQLFGDAVHIFFVEPCASACMLVRMAFGDAALSVYDLGMSNRTDADGLAVAQASELAWAMNKDLVAGICTVADDDLFRYCYRLASGAGMRIEPSAAAGFAGIHMLANSDSGNAYLAKRGLHAQLAGAAHVVWTTGGDFVPKNEMDGFIERGRHLCDARTV